MFGNKTICITGKLLAGTRQQAEERIRQAGGKPVRSVAKNTDFLVVGLAGWPLMKDGKISKQLQKAEQLQQQGFQIRVLSEQSFFSHLGDCGAQPPSPAEGDYDVAAAADYLGVEQTTVNRCIQFGLIRGNRDKLDFQDLIAIKSSAALMHQGMHAAALAQGLMRLSRHLPEIERPLSQLRVAIEHGELIAELDGRKMTVDGQLLLDFEHETAPGSTADIRARWNAFDWFDHAYQCEQQNRHEAAAEAYEQVCRMEPYWVEAVFNLGNVYRQLGRKNKALHQYTKATSMDPNWYLAWYNLGHLYDELGLLTQAVEAFQSALDKNPNHADAHYNLARCLEQLNMHGHAVLHWRAYLQISPQGELAHVAREYLSRDSLIRE